MYDAWKKANIISYFQTNVQLWESPNAMIAETVLMFPGMFLQLLRKQWHSEKINDVKRQKQLLWLILGINMHKYKLSTHLQPKVFLPK